MLLRTQGCMYLFEFMFLFPLDVFPQVELLYDTVVLFSTFWGSKLHNFDGLLFLGQKRGPLREQRGLRARLVWAPILALSRLWGLGQDSCFLQIHCLHLCGWMNTARFCRGVAKSGNSGPIVHVSRVPLTGCAPGRCPPLSQTPFWSLQDDRTVYWSHADMNCWQRVVSPLLSVCNYLHIPLHFTHI